MNSFLAYWGPHVYGDRTDNRWATRVRERVLRDWNRSRGRQLTQWRDEITKFAKNVFGHRRIGAVGCKWESPSLEISGLIMIMVMMIQ